MKSSRRDFVKTLGAGLLAGAPTRRPAPRSTPRLPMIDPLVYVGTYTDGASEGIYCFRLRMQTGALEPVGVQAGVVNPSYLALDAAHRRLFAVNETMQHQGQPGGAVSAFAIDAATGGLTLRNQQPTHGGAPCYVSVDRSGAWVLVANYMGGNVALLPVQPGGILGPAADVVQHTGSGPDKNRQEGPHAHAIVLDPESHFAVATDLGADRLLVYRLDRASGRLAAHNPPYVQAPPGSGPRHFVFHPSAPLALSIQELSSTITTYRYNPVRGRLQPIMTVPTLPDGFDGPNTCADLHLTPDGRFVYGSNRGHDSLVAFALDADAGRLTYIAHTPTQGRTPRNFAIDPTGTYLLAANQATDTVVTFRIQPDTGRLEPTGHVAAVPTPVCLKLLSA